MPRIEVRASERTFSKQMGAMHWLAGSLLALRLYPATWEVWDMDNPHPKKIGSLLLHNAIKGWNFTIVNDWKRGELLIRLQFERELHQWLIAPRGDNSKGLIVEFQRTNAPLAIIWRAEADHKVILARKETLLLDADGVEKRTEFKKRQIDSLQSNYSIMLGCHKTAHWSCIDQRCNLTELAPILCLAGQWASKTVPTLTKGQSHSGELALQKAGLDQSDLILPKLFERFWRTHFTPWAFPHWGDIERTGLEPLWQEPLSPLYLYILIETWFLKRLFKQRGDELTFLPSLPAICHAGRIENLSCMSGNCGFNWSKKRVQQITFNCSKSAILTLFFQKQTRSVRVCRTDRRHGAIYSLDQQGALKLHVACGRSYRIDRLSD